MTELVISNSNIFQRAFFPYPRNTLTVYAHNASSRFLFAYFYSLDSFIHVELLEDGACQLFCALARLSVAFEAELYFSVRGASDSLFNDGELSKA